MRDLVQRYALEPHPEGGWYREVYRSPVRVFSPVAGAERCALTHIHFLLERGQVSRFHRVVHEEIWSFHRGEALRLVVVTPTGEIGERRLGPGEGACTAVVPAGHWQAAEPLGSHALVGCTVAPGFEFEDFSFLDPASEVARTVLKLDPTLRRFLSCPDMGPNPGAICTRST